MDIVRHLVHQNKRVSCERVVCLFSLFCSLAERARTESERTSFQEREHLPSADSRQETRDQSVRRDD